MTKTASEKLKDLPEGRVSVADSPVPRKKVLGAGPYKRHEKFKSHQDPTKPLTIKEQRFVASRIKGKSLAEAAMEAGSNASTRLGAAQTGMVMARKANVKKAIENALINEGATPEWAAAQLVKIARQDGELEVKRKAVMDILKLHGWKEGEKPEIALEIKNAFFGEARKARVVIDADPQ